MLVLATLWAYASAFQGSFQFDDYAVIVDNPAVASWSAWWQGLPGIRPLLKASYTFNRQWPDAWVLTGFHAFNVAVHLGNVLLFYTLARQLNAPGALLAALVFAVHPVNTEAVTLISGRSMSLMTLLYLASIVCYLERRRGLSLLAWGLALAVRETALTLPLALWLIEWQLAPTGNGTQGMTAPPTDQLRRLRPYIAAAVVAVMLLAAVPHYRHLAAVSLDARPVLDNLISQSGAVLYLLGQWAWPTQLNADPVLPVFTGWRVHWLVTVAACAGGLIWAVRTLWRGGANLPIPTRQWVAFGLLWCALHLAPTNSLLPRLDLANERHLYLAGMGLCLALGAIVAHGWQRARMPAVVACAALVLTLGVLTQQRNAVYRDEIGFWLDVAQKSPTQPRAWNNLGYALAAGGQAAAAFDAYARARVLAPDDFLAILNQRALCREHAARHADLGLRCIETQRDN